MILNNIFRPDTALDAEHGTGNLGPSVGPGLSPALHTTIVFPKSTKNRVSFGETENG